MATSDTPPLDKAIFMISINPDDPVEPEDKSATPPVADELLAAEEELDDPFEEDPSTPVEETSVDSLTTNKEVPSDPLLKDDPLVEEDETPSDP